MRNAEEEREEDDRFSALVRRSISCQVHLTNVRSSHHYLSHDTGDAIFGLVRARLLCPGGEFLQSRGAWGLHATVAWLS
jgi:hypothetical protein